MRISKLAFLRGLASLYVNVVRGTPLFLQIYIAFFGLPLAGVNIPSYPLGVIVEQGTPKPCSTTPSPSARRIS